MITYPFGKGLTQQVVLTIMIGSCLILIGCGGRSESNPEADFSVISSPRVPALAGVTPTPTLTSTSPSPPTATVSDVAIAAETPEAEGPTTFEMSPATIEPTTPLIPTETPTPTETASPVTPPTSTPTSPPPTPTPRPVTPPDEPRRGGSWDLEDGFVDWSNPYGDDCSGSKVAVGWQGFTSRGQYGSSCFVHNEYTPNVFSGGHSQEVTFDFVDSHAGLYRTFDSKPNHQYQVIARLRHVGTTPPMQFHFGYDLTGGTSWEAETVQWTPWREFLVDQWMAHEQTFVATGPSTTIYIKGFHDTATQGGATYIDAIEVVDLGEQ